LIMVKRSTVPMASVARHEGTFRSEHGLDGTVLMYVGNLAAYQRVDLLLEGLALPTRDGADVHLVIAGGNPPLVERYRKKSDKLGLAQRCRFIGPWPVAKLRALLAEADILTSPPFEGRQHAGEGDPVPALGQTGPGDRFADLRPGAGFEGGHAGAARSGRLHHGDRVSYS